MLNYNQIKPGIFIELDGEAYEVLESRVFRKQQRKAVNQTKLRGLVSGSVREQTFQQSDSVREAEIQNTPIVFIYERRGEYWFHTAGDRSERFALPEETIGPQQRFLVNGMEVSGLLYRDRIQSISLPIKADLRVTEAPPGVKGNTAQGGSKRVTLESGAEVEVPMFVETGDTVRVNTQTGEYDTRVSKGE